MARAINIDKAIEKLEAYKDEANMQVGNLDNYDDGDADDAYWCGYLSGVVDCIFSLDGADWKDMETVTRCYDCKYKEEFPDSPYAVSDDTECYCKKTGRTTYENFFCKYGKPRNKQ